MKQTPIIFAFGVPRSGTTLAERWIQSLPASAAHTSKLQEGSDLHPKNSDEGLKQLQHIYASRKVVFVWIQRTPIGIFQSLYAAKKIKEQNLEEVNPADMKGVRGIARKTPEVYFKYIDDTYYNTKKQMGEPCVPGGPLVEVLPVQYERLGETAYQRDICRKLVRRAGLGANEQHILERFLKEYYGKKPVRSGALSYGIRNKVELPPELVEKIIEKYG